MNIDTNKIDEAVLGLLYLSLHDGNRAWKGMDWDATDRLFKTGSSKTPFQKTNLSCLPS